MFTGLTAQEAQEFAAQWLPAWTGNDPHRLASFYTDDAFYCDPAIPRGVEGRAELLAEVEFEGVCTVQLRAGRIRRNEVYFDRTALLAATGTR